MSSLFSNRIKTASDSLPAEVNELLKQIGGLPEEYRPALEQCAERIIEFTRRRRRILNLVQEALGQLRLDMKYLMFDLDATRQERDQYKRALDDQER